MIEIAKDTEIEKLITVLTKAAYNWGEQCGEEGYDANGGDSYVESLRRSVTEAQDKLYLYMLGVKV
jgi:hypothetical protein